MKRQIFSTKELQTIYTDILPQKRGRLTPHFLVWVMLSDFHPRVQYGKWEWVTLKWRNLANITLSRWLRSTSIVINHVDRIFSWYNAFVTLLPTSPKPSLITRIILENSNGRSSYKILNINSPNSQNHEKKTKENLYKIL